MHLLFFAQEENASESIFASVVYHGAFETPEAGREAAIRLMEAAIKDVRVDVLTQDDDPADAGLVLPESDGWFSHSFDDSFSASNFLIVDSAAAGTNIL